MARTKTSARQTLLDAAITLLSDNPSISFVEIAEAAGVGRASLYRHFPTREDLLREVSIEAIKVMDDAVKHIFWEAKTTQEAFDMTIKSLVPLGHQISFLARIEEVNDKKVMKALKRQNDDMIQLIKAAQKENLLDPAVNPHWINDVFNGLIVAAWSNIKQNQITNDQASDLVSRSLFSGLSSPK